MRAVKPYIIATGHKKKKRVLFLIVSTFVICLMLGIGLYEYRKGDVKTDPSLNLAQPLSQKTQEPHHNSTKFSGNIESKKNKIEPEKKMDAANYFEQAQDYYKKGQIDDAISNYTKAIELGYYEWIYVYRGDAYFKKGQYDNAISDYSKYIDQQKRAYPVDYYKRGNAYFEKKQYTNAIFDYTKAIELDPAYGWAYYKRGNIYLTMGQYDNAISDYTKSNLQYSLLYNNLGDAYFAKNQYNNAITAYTWAIELNPKNVKFFRNRGAVYEKIGKYEEAEKDYAKARKLEKK